MGDPDFELDPAGLGRALELLGEHFAAAGEPLPGAPAAASWPSELPEDGIGGAAALERLAPAVLGGAARLGHPGYFAHMDPPTPWPAWAGALWAAALNQNLLHPESAPVARDLERAVVGWLAPAFGMDGGHLLPGSSLANLTALWAARELRGVTVVAASELAHLSVRKAADLLGLELVELPAGRDDHRLRVTELDIKPRRAGAHRGHRRLRRGRPARCVRDAAWRHVDAAWAGPLRLSERHAEALLTPAWSAPTRSASGAQVAIPAEGVRRGDVPRQRRRPRGALLRRWLPGGAERGLLGSHGASALPLALTLLAWGRRERPPHRALHGAFAAARRAGGARRPTRAVRRAPATGVVLWRPARRSRPPKSRRLDGAFVSLSTVHGETWLRSVAANPNADPDLVVDAVLAALAQLSRGPSSRP